MAVYGRTLARVTAGGRTGLLLVDGNIGGPNSLTPLGPAVSLFVTRNGLADFAATDPVAAELELDPDEIRLMSLFEQADLDERVAHYSVRPGILQVTDVPDWLVLLDRLAVVCGLPATAEDDFTAGSAARKLRLKDLDALRRRCADLLAQVASRIVVRTEFERPGYAEADFWLGADWRPAEVALPSGTGFTLVGDDAVHPEEAHEWKQVPFLCGADGRPLMFRSEDDLLAHLADTWPAGGGPRPPHCHAEDLHELVALAEPSPWGHGDTPQLLRSLIRVMDGDSAAFRREPLSTLMKLLGDYEDAAEHMPADELRDARDSLADLVAWVDGALAWR